MKAIFFGTPSFAADVLTYLLNNGVSICAVITKPDKPKGRSGSPIPTPVKIVAEAAGLPVYQPELVSAPEFSGVLEPYEADLFVVVAYGEIIKQHLLDMPKLGCINVHASLLPKLRGAAPIQRSIIEGDTETGVTIMHLVKKMDAGDIIRTATVPIGPDTTYGELEKLLCEAGSKSLLEVILDFEKGPVASIPQDHTQATYAPKIELVDCELRWDKSAKELHDLVRGVMPHPGAWCKVTVRGQPLRLKVNKTHVEENPEGMPGHILDYGKGGILVKCREGALRLVEVQLEGKKVMPAGDLARGIPRDLFKIV